MSKSDSFLRAAEPIDPEKGEELEIKTESKSHLNLWAIIGLFAIIGGVAVIVTILNGNNVKDANTDMAEFKEMFASIESF